MLTFSLYLSLLIIFFLAGSVVENCLTWAIRQKILFGGKILYRKSIFYNDAIEGKDKSLFLYKVLKIIPHFVWVDKENNIWQYSVKESWKKGWFSRSFLGIVIALLYYDGEIKKGDPVFGDVYKKNTH